MKNVTDRAAQPTDTYFTALEPEAGDPGARVAGFWREPPPGSVRVRTLVSPLLRTLTPSNEGHTLTTSSLVQTQPRRASELWRVSLREEDTVRPTAAVPCKTHPGSGLGHHWQVAPTCMNASSFRVGSSWPLRGGKPVSPQTQATRAP